MVLGGILLDMVSGCFAWEGVWYKDGRYLSLYVYTIALIKKTSKL